MLKTIVNTLRITKGGKSKDYQTLYIENESVKGTSGKERYRVCLCMDICERYMYI